MRNNKIAVVGDKDSVLAFKAIGVEVFSVNGFFEAREIVKKLARDYAVIFITEEIAKELTSLTDRYKARAYPVIIPIPSAAGTTGYGMEGIKKDVEKAIGADILFNK